MARESFFDDTVKQRTTEAIRRIEEQTAAEVVVALRPRASFYLPTSLAAGAVCALLAFAVMWWGPGVYDVRTIPLDAALIFLVTAAVVHLSDTLKRTFTPRRVRDRAVQALGRRLFDELGIERTRDRTGLLVCISLFERDATVVLDRGIDRAGLGQAFDSIEAGLKGAIHERNVNAFLDTLLALGPPLGAQLPRKEDDENELSDTVA